MALRRKTVKSRPLRRTARRRRAVRPPRRMKLYRSRTTYNTGRSVIGNRFKTKLVWSKDLNLGNTGSILWQNYFIGDMFSPDGTSHQPMGFDQLCGPLYRNYTVTGCKMIIEGRFRSADTTTDQAIGTLIVGAQGSDISPPNLPTTVATANESRQYVTVTYTDLQKVRFKKYFKNANVFGIDYKTLLTEMNYSGSVSGSPLVYPIVNVGICGKAHTSNINFQHSITLVFYCQFYNPVPLGPS